MIEYQSVRALIGRKKQNFVKRRIDAQAPPILND
jgi:hypothetical protein